MPTVFETVSLVFNLHFMHQTLTTINLGNYLSALPDALPFLGNQQRPFLAWPGGQK